MIERIHVQNLRCLRDVDVELGPLTVFVGPNGSGKSTLLRVPTIGVYWQPDEFDFFQRDLSLRMVVELTVNGATSRFSRSMQSREGSLPRIDSQFIAFDLSKLRSLNEATEQNRMAREGENLPNLFASIGRKQQQEFSRLFCDLIPHFADVDVKPSPNASGHQRILFEDRWRNGVWYETREVSDGTMLAFAFLLLRFQPHVPDVILIEEPERGLHPYLLGKLVDLLRGLSVGRFGGKPIQVLMATHSAELLDHLKPEEVRFLSRSATDGSVKVERAKSDTPQWSAAFREYDDSLGSLWLSGGLGGVPGSTT